MKLNKETVSIRYGKALYELAAEQKATDAVYEELATLNEVFNEIPDLGNLLTDVRLKLSDKKVILNDLLSGFDGIVANFIQVVFDAGRMDSLPLMIAEYKKQYDEDHGIATGTVTSAVPLSAEQKANVEAKAAALFGYQTAQLNEIVDPTVIGGIRISVNNRVVDMTLKRRLDCITRSLMA